MDTDDNYTARRAAIKALKTFCIIAQFIMIALIAFMAMGGWVVVRFMLGKYGIL